MYGKVLNHYVNRQGVEAIFTRQAAMKLRENADGQRTREVGGRDDAIHLCEIH